MRQSPPVDLSNWASTFSCYTAALAVWLAVRRKDWWRPLLAGTPTLVIRPATDGLMRFEHHPRPPLEMLGLQVRYSDDWPAACAGLHTELAERGAVIICGDTYRLPWQRGYRRRHAPHWFTVLRHGADLLVDDPLEMRTEDGPQAPYRAAITPGALAEWSAGPVRYRPAQRLRELSAAGAEPLGIGARYRWMSAGTPLAAGEAGTEALTGPASIRALAEHCRRHGLEVLATEQSDDLWQALRQRELFLAAARHDPDLVAPDVRAHWRAAIEVWRRVPPVLFHTRLCLRRAMPIDRQRVAAVIEAVAAFESAGAVVSR